MIDKLYLFCEIVNALKAHLNTYEGDDSRRTIPKMQPCNKKPTELKQIKPMLGMNIYRSRMKVRTNSDNLNHVGKNSKESGWSRCTYETALEQHASHTGRRSSSDIRISSGLPSHRAMKRSFFCKCAHHPVIFSENVANGPIDPGFVQSVTDFDAT